MHGVMVHAQLTAQLLDNRLVNELEPMHAKILFSALALLGLILGVGTRLRGYNIPGILVMATLVGIDLLVFWKTRTILPFTMSLFAWIIGITAGSFLHRFIAGKDKHRSVGVKNEAHA